MVAAGVISFAAWQAGQISARRAVAAETSNYQCQSGDDCAAEQLQASVRASNAAEDAVDLALWQLALGLFSVGGLAFTVYYARRAWVEAQRSANAAHEALDDTRRDAVEQEKRFTEQLRVAADAATAATRHAEIAEDAARKQLRAYLYAESLWFRVAPEGYPLFTLTLRNTGATPAVNVRCAADYEFGGVTALPVVRRDATPGRDQLVGAGVAKETTLLVRGYKDIRVADIDYNERMLHVMGYIRYDDVFGDEYETQFAFFTGDQRSNEPFGSIAGHRPTFSKIGRSAQS